MVFWPPHSRRRQRGGSPPKLEGGARHDRAAGWEHIVRESSFATRSRHGVAIRPIHTGLCFCWRAFVFITLGAVVFLADREFGAAFGGMDSARPATASNESDQVASRQPSTARGESKKEDLSVARLVKAPGHLLEEILRH
jgi:hypothetical protein